MKLTLPDVVGQLSRVLDQKLRHQAVASGHPAQGAWIHPDWDLPDPQANATGVIVFSSALLLIAAERGLAVGLPVEQLRSRAELGLDYLLKAQRETGRIDNPSCNPDSDPDTAFLVQQLGPIVMMMRETAVAGGEGILEKAVLFIERAGPGLREGGFHTPNHRWVIASALLWCEAVLESFSAGPVLEQLIAEGIDIDADGAYQERSIEGYDGVSGRALMMIHELRGWPEAVEAVTRNLELDRHLLHADLTCEIGLSHRLYHSRPSVPIGLATVALMLHRATPDPRWPDLAASLFTRDAIKQEFNYNLAWLLWILLRDGEPTCPPTSLLPDRFAQYYPTNQFIRHRHDELSMTLFGHKQQLARILWHDLGLDAVSIRQSLLGPAGDFIASSLTLHDDHHATLISDGRHAPQRLVYWYPLGVKVPVEQWEQTKAQRDFRPVPPAAMQLEVEFLPDGAAFHLTSLGGHDRVPTQIALDFRPGGQWLTSEATYPTTPGQVFFHRGGTAAMRYGQTQIEIKGGHYAHGMRLMRDSLPAPEHVRILITLSTPLDHAFSLHCRPARSL